MSLEIEATSSPNRLIYSREFLVSYQNIRKPDQGLVEIMKPYLTPNRKPPTTANYNGFTPAARRPPFVMETPEAGRASLADARSPPSSPSVLKVTGSTQAGQTNNSSIPRSQTKKTHTRPSRPVVSNPPRSPLADLSRTPVRAHVTIPRFTLTPNSSLVNKENVANSTSANDKTETPSRKEKFTIPQFNLQEALMSESVSAEVDPSQTPKETPSTPGLALSPESAGKTPKTPGSGSSPKVVDVHTIEQRQKQIDYGHQTLGYLRYRLLVPKDKRSRDDPRTPKKQQACSKRSWDGQVKKWRRDLHKWDPEDPEAFISWLESDFVMKMIENNIGPEVIELIQKIKERAAKFDTLSPLLSPTDRVTSDEELDDGEKVARKLVF